MKSKLNSFYSAADEEKIWNNILSRIDSEDVTEPEKDIFEPEISPKKKSITRYIPMLTAAAAVIVIVSIANVPVLKNEASMSDSAEDVQYIEEPCEAASDEAVSDNEIFFPAERGWNYADVSVSSAKSYSYSDFSYDMSPSYEDNYSDDFFVESEVLGNTDFFLDCTVDMAEYDPVTETVTYTVSPIHVICPESIILPRELEVISGRAFVLDEGKEYLLPITVSDGEYHIADISSPQIELTGDGYVIFQNGWKSLTDGDEQYLWKTSSSPDDFFYDRMNITAESKLQKLFDNFLDQ